MAILRRRFPHRQAVGRFLQDASLQVLTNGIGIILQKRIFGNPEHAHTLPRQGKKRLRLRRAAVEGIWFGVGTYSQGATVASGRAGGRACHVGHGCPTNLGTTPLPKPRGLCLSRPRRRPHRLPGRQIFRPPPLVPPHKTPPSRDAWIHYVGWGKEGGFGGEPWGRGKIGEGGGGGG